ncbi:tripartite tricarboxylate transporter TctB family protein [Salinicola halophyticus]|uniref:tripartite tricarboxylate transporter TctB family protein n=1 Tax=Salinicola halophyticus TaxID=1808881 RepID=UPI003F47AF3C
MKSSEIVLLTGITAFAWILLFNSFDMPLSSGMNLGPGFLPLIISVTLLAVIAIRAVSLFSLTAAGKVHGEEGSKRSSNAYPALGIVVFIGVMALMIVAMGYVGILLPLGITMALVSRYFSGHSMVKSIGVTLLVLLVIYAVFAIWLKIPLR